MPIVLNKKGGLNYRKLTRDEGELLAAFLDLQIDRFVKELAVAKAMDMMDPDQAGAGKQALYAEHATKAFRQVLAVLLQSMRLQGLLRGPSTKTQLTEGAGSGALDFGAAE